MAFAKSPNSAHVPQSVHSEEKAKKTWDSFQYCEMKKVSFERNFAFYEYLFLQMEETH